MNIIVIGLYVVFSLILTYPVVVNMRTHLAGGLGDQFDFVWSMWWVKKAFLEGKNLYRTDLLFYPNKINLEFNNFSLFNSLFLAIPIQILLGLDLITTYNILFLFSFVLRGYGMFALIDYLTKNHKIAFLAGFAFAFSPYHFAHGMSHFPVITTGWIPIYIMFLIKTLKEGYYKNAILSGLMLSLVSLNDWRYMIFMWIFSVFYILYFNFFEKPINKKRLTSLAIILVTFAITIAPFATPLLIENVTHDYMKLSGVYAVDNHVKLNYYLSPNPFHFILGKFASHSNPTESVVSLGYTVIIIALIFIAKNLKNSILWLFSGTLFLILSLGPKPFGLFNIPIYESFYHFFPLFSFIPVSGRFGLMVLVSAIVLFSYGLNQLIRKNKKPDRILLIVFILIFFESLSIPFQTTHAVIPAPIYELSKEESNFTIANIPLTYENANGMYFQTAHNRPMVDGYISRTPVEAKKQVEGLRKSMTVTGVEELEKWYDVKYVIVHKRKFGKIEDPIIANNITGEKIYDDERVTLYKLNIFTDYLDERMCKEKLNIPQSFYEDAFYEEKISNYNVNMSISSSILWKSFSVGNKSEITLPSGINIRNFTVVFVSSDHFQGCAKISLNTKIDFPELTKSLKCKKFDLYIEKDDSGRKYFYLHQVYQDMKGSNLEAVAYINLRFPLGIVDAGNVYGIDDFYGCFKNA